MNFSRHYGGVFIGNVTYSPGGKYGPRLQPDYQLVILHAGKLDLEWDEEHFDLREGEAVLLPPGHREFFRFDPEQKTQHAWCSIEQPWGDATWIQQLGDRPAIRPWTGRLDKMLDLLTAPELPEKSSIFANAHMRLLSLALIAEFLSDRDSDLPQQHPSILKVRSFIREHYSRTLSLDDLARAGGVSNQHLLRIFRESSLDSPLNELWVHRLEIAADLLGQTGLSIEAISQQCGFANPYHFSRRFKKQYTKSPSTYRRKKWDIGSAPLG